MCLNLKMFLMCLESPLQFSFHCAGNFGTIVTTHTLEHQVFFLLLFLTVLVLLCHDVALTDSTLPRLGDHVSTCLKTTTIEACANVIAYNFLIL